MPTAAETPAAVDARAAPEDAPQMFMYRTGLPSAVDSENIEADLDHGILTVRIPKTEEAKRRKVGVGRHKRISGETA